MAEENLFERVYPEIWVDEAEYFHREERTSHRHEFLGGRMRHLPLGGLEHARICGHFRAELGEGLPDDWWIAGSTLRLKIEATGLRTYADAVLITPETRFVREGGDSDTVLNPTFLGEVSDEATEVYDRTLKFDHYRQIPSLRDYVRVCAGCVRVEHFARCGDEWTLRVYTRRDENFTLSFLNVELSLSRIYKDISLPANEDFWRPIPEGLEQ